MNIKRRSSIAISLVLLILLTVTSLPNITTAQETVTGTQDPETTGVWLFSAGKNEPAEEPTSQIIKAAVDHDILDYIGDSAAEVYAFGYGPSEPTPGQQDKTLAEVIQGLSAIDDFGLLDNANDDAANFDTGHDGYVVGGFDPADPHMIVADGIMATGELGPSGAANATAAEEAISGYEIFIFEDAELSGMIVTLNNSLGLSITFSIEDLQVDPPTRYGADDTLIAIDLDNLTGFDSEADFVETIKVQDDSVTSPSEYGDTTLEIDAIATRSLVAPPPAKLIIQKFNDTNGNGFFDESIEKMITGWKIDVRDPDSLITSYNTPINLEITNFGTYTITEDLPEGWEQTALFVDGEKRTPSPETDVDIGTGEEHNVLYGNREVPEHLQARLILDKFNDTNGNGIHDAGDIKITDWRINVTDPHGVTATYLTPAVLEITEFGTYTITEDIPDDWEQTAVEVDGTYIIPPTVEVTVLISENETHNVLYGNKLRLPPPPPPPIGISLYIYPILVYVGEAVIFSWSIDSPPEVTPDHVELYLKNPEGVTVPLETYTLPPWTGSYVWTSTTPTGFWRVYVDYHYTYLGHDFMLSAYGLFTVRAGAFTQNKS